MEITVTARDFAQTLGLLELYGIPHTVIGRHGGAAVRGQDRWGWRGGRRSLIRFGRGKGFTIAVSHGSNDLAVAAKVLRIHSTVIHDFEGATGMHKINFRLADKVMVPGGHPVRAAGRPGPGPARATALRGHQGAGHPGRLHARPLRGRPELGLDPDRPIAVLRPPATMCLYHRGLENTLFTDVLATSRGPTRRSCCCRGPRSRRRSSAARRA